MTTVVFSPISPCEGRNPDSAGDRLSMHILCKDLKKSNFGMIKYDIVKFGD
jgi:hypothetical protein